jgi:hypothetical protein
MLELKTARLSEFMRGSMKRVDRTGKKTVKLQIKKGAVELKFYGSFLVLLMYLFLSPCYLPDYTRVWLITAQIL